MKGRKPTPTHVAHGIGALDHHLLDEVDGDKEGDHGSGFSPMLTR